eukprot:104900-Alexandrium_andersonii.AAC.1
MEQLGSHYAWQVIFTVAAPCTAATSGPQQSQRGLVVPLRLGTGLWRRVGCRSLPRLAPRSDTSQQ